MALSIAPTNYQLIHECLNTTGWTGSSTALVTDFSKRGAACVGFILRTSGNNDVYVTGNWDLTGKTLRAWYMTAALKEVATEAAGGIQFFLFDGTNTGYWTVGGSDTYPGGWMNYCVDVSRTPDAGTQPNLAAITRVGMRIVMTSAPKNAQNTWIDYVQCSDALSCSETVGSFGLNDVYEADNALTGAWGIMRRFGGVYYATGGLTLDGFDDASQTLVFENRPVGSSLYTIDANGNFKAGDIVGTAGVSGISIRTQSLNQTAKWFLTCTAEPTDDFKIYGTSLLDSGDINLPIGSATREVLNTSFEGCGLVTISNCKIRQSNFISAKNQAILMPPNNSHDITDSFFINNNNAILIDNVGTYTFNNLNFTGNIYDIDNTSGDTITINATGSSNPSTYTGAVVIQNTKSFTFTLSPVPTDYEWRIYEKDPEAGRIGTELVGEEHASTASKSYQYNYLSDINIAVQIISPGEYEEFLQYYTLGNIDQSININLIKEINQ